MLLFFHLNINTEIDRNRNMRGRESSRGSSNRYFGWVRGHFFFYKLEEKKEKSELTISTFYMHPRFLRNIFQHEFYFSLDRFKYAKFVSIFFFSFLFFFFYTYCFLYSSIPIHYLISFFLILYIWEIHNQKGLIDTLSQNECTPRIYH